MGGQTEQDRLLYHLDGVSKEREKGGVRFTLKVPYFKVRAGSFLLISGPSGCGKSTLLDLLGLVLSPSAARRFRLRGADGAWNQLDGLADAAMARLRGGIIGYVLQSGGLLPYLTVRENILLTRRLNGMPADKEHARTLAARLGIEAQLGKKPAHLSGGQRQRVAIARALAHEPVLLLADEPTAAVDRETAMEIRNQLVGLCKGSNTAVVLVSHDADLFEPVSDQVYGFDLLRRSENDIVSSLVLARSEARA